MVELSSLIDEGEALGETAPGVFGGIRLGRQSTVSLPAGTPISNGHQEGGTTLLLGTFTPDGSTVTADVRISASSTGWAGHHVDFNIGVLPGSPPTPWEPGAKGSKISRLQGSPGTPLTGVTEYDRFVLPQVMPGYAQGVSHRRIEMSGLTPGRVYQWEIRAGGQSYYKTLQLEATAEPRYISLHPGGELIWVGCKGTSTVQLCTKGWTITAGYSERTQDPTILGRVVLPGVPCAMRCQRTTGRYVAVIDETNQKLVIVDGWALTVVGSYTLPGSDNPAGNNLVWNAAGTKVWVGSASAVNGARVHRFDIATLAFDASVLVDPSLVVSSVVQDITADDTTLIVADHGGVRVANVNTTSLAVTTRFTTAGVFVFRAAVRADGTVAVLDASSDTIRIYSPAGTYLGGWSAFGTGAAPVSVGSIAFDPSGQQVYWSDDKWVGWGWVDSLQRINVADWFAETYVGEIAITPESGILTAHPFASRVGVWAGGLININSDEAGPNPFGSQRCDVTFEGAEATGA